MNRSLTLTDAAVLFCLLLILGAGVVVGNQQQPNRTKMNEHARGLQAVHQGCYLYANNNNDFFPGIDGRTGKLINEIKPARSINYGAAKPSETDISAIYAILLNSEYIEPKTMISPLETDASKKAIAALDTATLTVTQANYSYAALQFASDKADNLRRKAWRVGDYAKGTPAFSDRSMAIDADLKTTSILVPTKTAKSTDWKGMVGWSDGSITLETSGVIKAERAKLGKVDVKVADDLFATNETEDQSANAMMTYGKHPSND